MTGETETTDDLLEWCSDNDFCLAIDGSGYVFMKHMEGRRCWTDRIYEGESVAKVVAEARSHEYPDSIDVEFEVVVNSKGGNPRVKKPSTKIKPDDIVLTVRGIKNV